MVALSRTESEANINLIISSANTEVVGDTSIARDSESDFEETTSTLQEINEAIEAVEAMNM